MATWEYKTIPVQRASPSERWRAEVQTDAAMVGWEAILNFVGADGPGRGADGWELVSLLPLTYLGAGRGLFVSEALAVFKRPFCLTAALAEWNLQQTVGSRR